MQIQRWQHLTQVEPLEGPAVSVAAWMPETPDPIRRVSSIAAIAALTVGSFVPPGPAAAPTLAAPPVYPDRIDRSVVRAVNQAAFFPTALPQNLFFDPSASAGWTPIYPDRIDRDQIHAARVPWFETGSTASSLPVPDDAWLPGYPDRIDRPIVLSALQQDFRINISPLAQPEAPFLSWQGGYPDRIDRLTLHPSRMPFYESGSAVFALGHQGWEGAYPDRIDRLTLPIALYQPLAINVSPIAQPESPFLAWQGDYTDRIDRSQVHPSRIPFLSIDADFSAIPPAVVGGAWGVRIDTPELGTSGDGILRLGDREI